MSLLSLAACVLILVHNFILQRCHLFMNFLLKRLAYTSKNFGSTTSMPVNMFAAQINILESTFHQKAIVDGILKITYFKVIMLQI